jgi:hypothetical protein
MVVQTYQQISDIIEEDLKALRVKMGFDTLGELNAQEYFYHLKLKNPEKYERLSFDGNGHKPFSKDLEQIFSDFRISGILKVKQDILPE